MNVKAVRKMIVLCRTFKKLEVSIKKVNYCNLITTVHHQETRAWLYDQ